MKKEHHTTMIHAAFDVIDHWRREAGGPDGLDLDAAGSVPGDDVLRLRRQMGKWCAQADDVDDLTVDRGLAEFICKRVSHPTSFQHFAYCGALDDLSDGRVTVETYDGYCWDCDPFLTWYEEIANVSWANVRRNVDNGTFDQAFWQDSPATGMVTGNEDWDDQKYPSALDMAEFYERHTAADDRDRALQALSFGVHMLQDMAVPQHVLCTVELGHSDYEAAMLRFWKSLYAGEGRSPRRRQQAVEGLIAPRVAAVIADSLADAGSMREVGRRAVDLTGGRLARPQLVPAWSKVEALDMTCLAIACTLKAFELAVRNA